jgi:two-component system, NarL family, sensor kinase
LIRRVKAKLARPKKPGKSLSLFRALIDRSNDAIEVVDPATLRFVDSNQKAFLDLGYTRDEFLALSVYDIDPTLNPKIHVIDHERLRTSGPFVKEGIHRRKDGSTFPVEVNLSWVELEESYVVVVARDITERKAAENSLRQLSVQLLHAQDEERRRVAREVHDSIGQYIAGLSLAFGKLRTCIDERDGDTQRIVSDCRRLVKAASREIRTISYLLHPPMIDELGLSFALRWLVRGYEERSGIGVSLEVPADLQRLKPEIEMALFRVAQESLSNVCRHAESATAIVRVTLDSRVVVLEVADRGKGMAPRSPGSMDRPGVGIAGIRARVQDLNGHFDLQSTLGAGVTIRVALPLA